MAAPQALGFIGLGTMGEPMCRNLARKSGVPVIGYDTRPDPLARLAEDGVEPGASVAALVERADIVFLSLPGGDQLEEVVARPGGILETGRQGQVILDHTTAPVDLTRTLAAKLEEKGIAYLDAPVARTRRAAIDGTLAIMVGGSKKTFDTVRPYLAHMGEAITYCGPVGNGQTAKLMNNMVLIQTVAALAGALAIGRRAGLDGELLFDVMSGGSADSFALRNHGMLSMVKGSFPEHMFSTRYALKDLTYALEIARQTGVDVPLAREAERLLRKTIDAGLGEAYFPAVIDVVEADEADG